MHLKIGELARRTGLTVRALHHYDDIGLLSPSVRSDAGYRLYSPDDVARLYRILALRQLGLPLADIGPLLVGDQLALPSLVDRQLAQLDARIAEAALLRERLLRLRQVLGEARDPTPDEWLTTMERMTMYEKYFTQDEVKQLEQRNREKGQSAVVAEWFELVATMRRLMDTGTPAASPEAQACARRWMALAQETMGGSPGLIPKMHAMYKHEPSIQAQTGIDVPMLQYVGQAAAKFRLTIYAKYLDDAEMARMSLHYGGNAAEWPPLIATIRTLMQAGIPVTAPEAREAVARWQALTSNFLGTDPATRAKTRTAMENEPELLNGTGIDLAMLDYVRAGTAAL
jgi:DNA-binding transcriptional MerR regulator